MKNTLSEEDEAQILIINATDLIKSFSDDFVNYRAGAGRIEIYRESPKFTITIRLERKKGIKKGNESKTG